MSNKTVGTILLVTASTCCTLGVVGAKIAYAIERGMHSIAKGGLSPQRPELGWEIGIAVVVTAGLGFVFLLKDKRPDSGAMDAARMQVGWNEAAGAFQESKD